MKIALDYDKTFTTDMRMWRAFIDLAKAYGHEVVCVTMRHPHLEPVDASIGIPGHLYQPESQEYRVSSGYLD